MFFDKPIYVTEYIGAFRYERRPYRFATPGRNFSVISLRYRGNTDFKTDKTSLFVARGDILFIPPNTAYTQTDNTEEELISVHFNTNLPLSDEIAVIGTADKNMEDLIKRLARLTKNSSAAYRPEALSALYTLFDMLMRKEQSKKAIANHPAVLADAIHLFETNYGKCDLNVTAAAAALGVSPSYLRRLFSEYFGISPSDYLRKIRMEHADLLLKSGYYRVYEVAEKCGYADAKTFSTAFRRETGCSPSSCLS